MQSWINDRPAHLIHATALRPDPDLAGRRSGAGDASLRAALRSHQPGDFQERVALMYGPILLVALARADVQLHGDRTAPEP